MKYVFGNRACRGAAVTMTPRLRVHTLSRSRQVLTVENASIGVVGLGEEFHVLTEAEVAPYVSYALWWPMVTVMRRPLLWLW